MLESIRIKGFKSYADATLNLSPLTIMIGANASGKSNATEALKLLSWIAQGNSLRSIASMVQQQTLKIRGLVKELGFQGKDAFEFTCNSSDASWSRYRIRLRTMSDRRLLVDGEELNGPSEAHPYFRARPSSDGTDAMTVEYNSFGGKERCPQFASTSQVPAIIQFDNHALIDRRYKAAQRKIPRAASECRNELSGMIFINPLPSKMRGYSFHEQKPLSEDGSNVSGVLCQLCGDSESKKVILEFVKSLPEQEISDIGFIETGRGDVMVTLAENFGDERRAYDATLLSDGTMRVLAAAAAVLSAPKGSLVVVEEIDNNLHPSRAARLLDLLSNIANARKLRILVGTHNTALLDGFPVSEISKVMVSYRNPGTGASELIQMGDIQNFPILAAKGRPGQLMASGAIDAFIKKNPGPEENRRRAFAWIESLRSYERHDS